MLGGAAISPVLRAAPDVPANVQVRVLPAELLFSWDLSAGAAYYQVYRGGPDRRWVPLPDHLTMPRFRDTDFTDLPSYYQVKAVDAAGEWAITPEFLVSNASSNCALSGHVIRPVSDTAVAIVWSVAGELADGMLEVGQGADDPVFFAVDTNYLREHEFIVTNLAPNSIYWFRLTSAASNRAGFTYRNTFSTQPYTEPPPLPISVVPRPDSIPELDEDRVLPILLTAENPTDAALQFFIEWPPQRGRLSGILPNVTYTPNIGSGMGVDDNFVCAVTDGLVTNEAVIDIWLRSKNHIPYARDDSVTVPQHSVAYAELRGFDIDRWPLTYQIIAGPTNGTLTLKDWPDATFFNYFPNTNFNGIDHFT